MSLSVEEQHLLNYLKIVHVSPQTETESVYRQILDSCGVTGHSSLKRAIASLNNVIKEYYMEVVEAVDEVTGRDVHCLIATKNRSVAQ